MATKKELSFEEALEKLEECADKLKSNDTSLEESSKLYENSIKYYKQCNEILKNIKQKIEIYNPENGKTEEFDEQ